MKEPVWLLQRTVLSFHDRLLAEFGGASGIRDTGMLESALNRPKDRFAYETATLEQLAASYAYGLVKNHPFVDGNKRIGFGCAALFLQVNGRPFAATEAEAVIRTLALAAGELDEAGYAAWLKENS
ncbi:type II toxin-antitoxin system death-on-curing family toxin [Pelagicoccus sp. SDUM812005]|uniref:type II toxin-antitoxin system death-on-curing family toxin n=1 Tax=Pelagicoccus sp. SDUM812005 TaxID=3041257 RepID=UPI00280D70E8|nr:type II toxin-antitoxin system death-on-curing family toxin [Pelagicoccus sp. SDUM812005]MDQ8181456.1 type II toxin-antitoxin system death-on-curing family toxin [Pelagicoccus sp. SDUM812005]